MANNELSGKINEQQEFIKFLTDKGMMDCFKEEITTTWQKTKYNDYHLPIPIDKKKKMVSYFYGETSGTSEGEKVDAILNGLEKNKYDIQVIPCDGYEKTFVGIDKDKAVINGKIFTSPTIYGLEDMVHEIGHALTGRNNRHIFLFERVKKARTPEECEFAEREYEGCCCEKGRPEYDSVGKIDTIALERMLIHFSTTDEKFRKVIEQYDFDLDNCVKEFDKEYKNMMFDRIRKIISAKQLLDKYNIKDAFKSEEEFKEFLSQLPSDLARENFMRDMEQLSENNAKYNFRYVSGEIVSKYWFDKFKASKGKETEELKDKFVEFWHRTDELNIDQAVALLCDGKMLEEVVSIYLERSQSNKMDDYEMV